MKENDKIRQLDFSEEFLMESAEKRFEQGDYFGALKVLNRRSEKYDPSADASALYADIYEALGLYSLCADAWFRFLDTCNEADFSEGYEGLSIAFMNMGDEFQSQVYMQRTFEAEGIPQGALFEASERPHLRLVHSEDGSVEDAEFLREGIDFIRMGELEKAKESFSEIKPTSRDFPSATGLTAMCKLLEGNVGGAADECEKLLHYYPDNIHALTTYCAVLGAKGDAEGAREIGKKLASLDVQSLEDLFRVSTALCETGLDEEAYQKLSLLKSKAPYGDDVLWFHAVSAFRTGRVDEAIDSLETLTTINPRKAVAKYYLIRMRESRDDPEKAFDLEYYYKVPKEQYKIIEEFFMTASEARKEDAENFSEIPEIDEYFRIAFDQMDGRDDKMQILAAHVAVKCRCERFLREILLDYNASESVKLLILRELVMRNEENSYGVVICGFYREFFTHELDIGERCREIYLSAFAEVYSKYALIGDENEEKLINAAEDVYRTLEESDSLDFAEEQSAISAVIYREARLRQSEHSIERISLLFGAKVKVVREILDYIL